MPDVVKLGGRPYPKSLLYVAGAATVGIVGYAWFTRGSGDPETEAELLVPEEPTGVLPFGGTVSGTFTEGPVAYRNDREWYTDALSKLLMDYGVGDTATASAALDRYLAGQALTAAQVPMINFVVNSIGPPPSGARNIRAETVIGPAPTSAPATPTGLKLTSTASRVGAQWSPVSGDGITYQVELVAGVDEAVQSNRIRGTAWYSSVSVRRKSPYRIKVWAVNSRGVHSSGYATATIHTK